MWARLLSDARRSRLSDGFTLVEVLVATALFSGGLVAVAQLVVLVSRSTLASRDLSYASILASQKLSELETDDVAGIALTLPDTWKRTAAGSVEYLGAAGELLSANGPPPDDAIYARRWSVTPLTGDPSGGVMLQVSAGRLRRQLLGSVPMDAAP